MNDTVNADLDQVDEENLTYNLSDEALEAAAGTEMGTGTQFDYVSHGFHCC